MTATKINGMILQKKCCMNSFFFLLKENIPTTSKRILHTTQEVVIFWHTLGYDVRPTLKFHKITIKTTSLFAWINALVNTPCCAKHCYGYSLIFIELSFIHQINASSRIHNFLCFPLRHKMQTSVCILALSTEFLHKQQSNTRRKEEESVRERKNPTVAFYKW